MRRGLSATCAAILIGVSCGSGEGPSAPSASLQLEVVGPIAASGNDYFLQINVIVGSTLPFQAYDVDLRWTPANAVSQVAFLPHSEFNDDGELFGAPRVDIAAGEITDIIDLRHGEGEAIAGPAHILSLLLVASGGQDVTLVAEGSVARPDGILFDTASAQALVSIPTP